MTKPCLIICLMENNCIATGLHANCICAAFPGDCLGGEHETLPRMFAI